MTSPGKGGKEVGRREWSESDAKLVLLITEHTSAASRKCSILAWPTFNAVCHLFRFFFPLSNWQRHLHCMLHFNRDIPTDLQTQTHNIILTKNETGDKRRPVKRVTFYWAVLDVRISKMSSAVQKKKQQAEAGDTPVPQIQLKQQSKSWKILHNASKKNAKNTRGLKADISWRLCQLYFTLSVLYFRAAGYLKLIVSSLWRKEGSSVLLL